MTNWSDGDLRRAYAALDRTRADRGPEPAVDPELILDLVEGRGDEATRLATLDAVMTDPASAREFELLRSLAAGRSRPQWVTRWRRAALPLAAAALVVAALPLLRRDGSRGAHDSMRNAETTPVLLLPPVEASPSEAATFVWRAVPGARAYDVEILTATGRPVFTTRTADTTLALPADVELVQGEEHLWWVSAELSDGTQRRSPFRPLLVRTPR